LSECSIMDLTWKFFFLVLLASGRRRSDVHAIDVSRVEFDNNRSVTLYPARDFLPRRAVAEGSSAFSPINIPSLIGMVGRDEPDSCLCPVRALREYISRTEPHRGGRKRLFISTQMNRRSDITTQTLSTWVKMLIQQVYNKAEVDALRLYKVSAHQVRRISVSLASTFNVSLEAWVRSGMWTNASTFTNFYLSNASATMLQAKIFKLGPLIAAQSVVNQ